MQSVLLHKSLLGNLIKALQSDYEVFGPTKKGLSYVWDKVHSLYEITLNYDCTILPPKKFVLPGRETMFNFTNGKITSIASDTNKKQVLFGIHACDLKAFSYLDKIYMGQATDPRYEERRQNLVLIAYSCIKPCDNGFCHSMGSGAHAHSGFDLQLTDLGERYIVEIGSEAGQKIIKLVETEPVSMEDREQLAHLCTESTAQFKKHVNTENLTKILFDNINHKVWDKIGEQCLACGQCALVCPTCFCFDIRDKVDLTLKSGERYRTWDVCLLKEFSEIALGENFRSKRKDRLRQFQCHNLAWSAEQFGSPKCVGCGRCIKVCPVHIDITETVSEIREKG